MLRKVSAGPFGAGTPKRLKHLGEEASRMSPSLKVQIPTFAKGYFREGTF